MKAKTLLTLFRDAASEWSNDKATRLGAALAYYTAFSLAPLLLLAISIASLVFGEEAARGEIFGQVKDTVGPSAAQAVQDLLKNATDSGGNGVAAVLGTVILLVGASGVFMELQDALNTVWKVPPPPGLGLLAMLRDRFLSFALVLGLGFLLLVSLLVSAVLAALGKYLSPDALPGGVLLWHAVNALVSLGVIALLFALIFKLLPDVPIRWGDVWPGAALTALLFTVGKQLIGLYLGQSSVASAYGAAGSLVVILVWVYYSAQIVLYGAEFTRLYARRFGSHRGRAPGAAPAPRDERRPDAVGVREPAGPVGTPFPG